MEGAKEAKGLAVMIDVFRAFSLESYLFAAGARRIYPVGDMEEARALAAEHPDWQEVYPRADFFLCTACDLFDFVIRIGRDKNGILFA